MHVIPVVVKSFYIYGGKMKLSKVVLGGAALGLITGICVSAIRFFGNCERTSKAGLYFLTMNGREHQTESAHTAYLKKYFCNRKKVNVMFLLGEKSGEIRKAVSRKLKNRWSLLWSDFSVCFLKNPSEIKMPDENSLLIVVLPPEKFGHDLFVSAYRKFEEIKTSAGDGNVRMIEMQRFYDEDEFSDDETVLNSVEMLIASADLNGWI